MSTIKKQVLLCAAGTIFEWYDFSLFACLTPILSQLFFHEHSAFSALMATFAIFGSGYIMRPLGALFFGSLGDRVGRKYSLLITIFTMTIATTAIGFIPTQWKYAAVLLIICRLMQGFSSSGEYPGVLTLLAEQNSTKHKSFIASTGVACTAIGSFIGALCYLILNLTLSNTHLLEWGWRIPFLLGAPLGILGYFLRKHILESSEFTQLQQQKLTCRTPLRKLIRHHYKSLLAVMSISILMNTVIYINYIYFGNYALSIHKLNPQQVIYLYLIFTFVFAASMLIFGFLSDQMNKLLLLFLGYLLTLVSIYPLFKLILLGSVLQQFTGQALMAFLLGIVLGPYATILPAQFPAYVRYSGLSITLNFSASFFGGSAPILCGWLTHFFGTPLAPAYYLLFLGTFPLLGFWYICKPTLVKASFQKFNYPIEKLP